MSSSRSLLPIGVAGLLAIGIAVWLLWPEAAPDLPLAPSAQASAPAQAQQAGPPPSPGAPAEPPATHRTAVPKPTDPGDLARVPAARAPRPAPGDGPGAAATSSGGPVDKRDDRGPDATFVIADIKANMDVVSEDIETCIEDWTQVAPNIDGKVNVAFTMDAEGLQEAWIVDHEDVPAGPLTCFSAAIWEVDWSEITEDPLEVTFPFVVTTGDSG